MAYDMHKLEGMQAAVVLYRNMKDTIRAQYAFHHGNGAFLEAPLRAYYGESFAFSLSLYIYIDGILPKGPYPPCLRMADRALLAGNPRYVVCNE